MSVNHQQSNLVVCRNVLLGWECMETLGTRHCTLKVGGFLKVLVHHIKVLVKKAMKLNWGEPERAPHRQVCCKFSVHIMQVATTIMVVVL